MIEPIWSWTKCLIILGILLTFGCGSDVKKKTSTNNPNPNTNNTATNNTATNNNTGTNNSTTPPVIVEPVEGEVALVVRAARQVQATTYALDITLANGLDEGISIAPSAFRIGVGGLELSSVDTSASTCTTGALVSSNASVECTLVFEDVNDTPDRLIYAGAEDEVVTNFTPVECEKCGETRCIDLQTSSVHCGQCDNEISYVEECENGVPTCEIGFRHEQGLCIPDVTNVSLKPASSTASCEEVCGESAYCEGVMATSACELAYDPVYPGSNNCRVSGAEMVYLADADPKCVLSTLFCACWTSSN